jgi:phosphoribosyl 1,2-cyclic phosphate phosphodiesterase
MIIKFLGTGTSDGVPMIGCECEVCESRDKRDKRTRSSIMITQNDKNYMVDTSIDFRAQILREKVRSIEAVFYTHHHSDHVSGIVDIRSINVAMNGKTINCYANEPTLEVLKQKYDFFFTPTQIGGGLPKVLFHVINEPIKFDDIKVTPLPIKHGVLDILGYRFNNFTYITDASYITDSTIKLIEGTEYLVLNALRYRQHLTHMSLQEAVDLAYKLKPKKTFLTHMTHDVMHKKLMKELPKGIEPAYDGLTLNV